ncbi:hypothetical protein, partial [Salmonella enterica]
TIIVFLVNVPHTDNAMIQTGSQHTPTPLPDYNDRTLFPHPIF